MSVLFEILSQKLSKKFFMFFYAILSQKTFK